MPKSFFSPLFHEFNFSFASSFRDKYKQMKNTIQQFQDSIQFFNSQREITNIYDQSPENFNWWLMISIVEFISIIILLIKLIIAKKKVCVKKNKIETFEKPIHQDIDMDNLMNSISFSRGLYLELSKKCHPDKFQDKKMKSKAERLFQKITINKRNYNELTALKELAVKELNIKF